MCFLLVCLFKRNYWLSWGGKVRCFSFFPSPTKHQTHLDQTSKNIKQGAIHCPVLFDMESVMKHISASHPALAPVLSEYSLSRSLSVMCFGYQNNRFPDFSGWGVSWPPCLYAEFPHNDSGKQLYRSKMKGKKLRLYSYTSNKLSLHNESEWAISTGSFCNLGWV